jgi:hypothetical protein
MNRDLNVVTQYQAFQIILNFLRNKITYSEKHSSFRFIIAIQNFLLGTIHDEITHSGNMSSQVRNHWYMTQ